MASAEEPSPKQPPGTAPAELPLWKDELHIGFAQVLEDALRRRNAELMQQIQHQHKQLLRSLNQRGHTPQKSWRSFRAEPMGTSNSEAKPTNSIPMMVGDLRTVQQVLYEKGISPEGHQSESREFSQQNTRIHRSDTQVSVDVYKTHQGSPIVRPSSKRLGVQTDNSDTSLPQPATWRSAAKRLAASDLFQAAIIFAVLGNCVVMGVQLELESVGAINQGTSVFFWLSVVFAAAFAIEMFVKLFAYGKDFFWDPAERWWNFADLVIVFCSIFDLCLQDITGENIQSVGQLRVVRVLFRMARITRVMKLVKHLRTLRTLLHSILGTLKAFLWALCLVSLLIYMFGIIFTEAVLFHLSNQPSHSPADVNVEELQRYFGSLLKSMSCLFQSISGGLEWKHAVGPLNLIHPFWSMLFTAYVAFLLFALLNVMTGVFCQSAIENAQRDRDLAVQNVMQNRQQFEHMLMELFNEIDDDGSGRIAITEFEHHFQDDAFKLLLHSLELEVEDALTLFMMLDQDGNHDIDANEFLEGCLNLKGPFKAIQGAKFKRHTEKKLAAMTDRLVEIQDHQLKTWEFFRYIFDRVEEPPDEFPEDEANPTRYREL